MKVFKYSNKGNRETNEDYVVSKTIGDGISLHLIADGMGGYDFGDIASKTVCESYLQALSKGLSISQATQEVSQTLQKERKSLGTRKMGSAVAGVYLHGCEAELFWAGDSRIYVFRKGSEIYQTEDHSIVNELSKVRQISNEERVRYGHIITRSIKGRPDDKVDETTLTLESGDEILVCTDGLYAGCPVDYVMDSIRANRFDLSEHNDIFSDNHSLIYILID